MKHEILSCNVVEDLLPLYSEGLCSEESRTLIETHIRICERCRKLHEQVPIPEIRAVQEPEKKKVFLKIHKKLKCIRIRDIVVCTLLGVILVGLGYLTVGQIRKDYHMQSFETVWQSIEVRQLVSYILKEDFDTYMKYISYKDYADFGLSEEELDTIRTYEKEQLQASYHAAFGGKKADRIQVKTNYGNPTSVVSIATVTFDNGEIMVLQFSESSKNLYSCYSVGPNNSAAREAFRRSIGYINDHNYVYYPAGWVQELLTRDKPLEENAKDSISYRFAPEYWESVKEGITAFYEKGYAVSDCMYSDLQYDREKMLLYYDIAITATDAEGTAILRTRIYNEIDGWIPPEAEEYTIYREGCSDGLTQALAAFFGEQETK